MAEQTISKAHVNAQNFPNLSQNFIIDFIYNSLLFEHPEINYEDVKKALSTKEFDSTNKQFSLIINHKKALDFVLDLVKNNQPLTEELLKDLHEVLMGEESNGGLYRKVDISIKGSNHTPPSYLKVYDRMKKYFLTLENYEGDILEKIAYSHVQLAKIHPFLDGNGRCARLVLNYFLLMNGLPPVIIYQEESKEYFNALEEYKVNKDISMFVNFLKKKIS